MVACDPRHVGSGAAMFPVSVLVTRAMAIGDPQDEGLGMNNVEATDAKLEVVPGGRLQVEE